MDEENKQPEEQAEENKQPARRGRPPKVQEEPQDQPPAGISPSEPQPPQAQPSLEISELTKKIAEQQKMIEMLYAVADRGRVQDYETRRQEKKPAKVNLSVFAGGLIVGWRTLRDELVKNETTGRTIGEIQQYELLVLGADNNISKHNVNGYPAFTEARYGQRVEVEVAARKEEADGRISFDLKLPDGRVYSLDSRFVN
jgi:hypothetical protein